MDGRELSLERKLGVPFKLRSKSSFSSGGSCASLLSNCRYEERPVCLGPSASPGSSPGIGTDHVGRLPVLCRSVTSVSGRLLSCSRA
jgi:hypothetical protein